MNTYSIFLEIWSLIRKFDPKNIASKILRPNGEKYYTHLMTERAKISGGCIGWKGFFEVS